MIKKSLKTEYAAVAVLLGVLVRLFFIAPVVGVADNGDFERIMYPCGLDFVDTRVNAEFFDYATYVFRSGPVAFWGGGSYVATHVLPVRAAKLLSDIFYTKGYFSTLFLAALYSALFLFAALLILKRLRTGNPFADAAISALFVWMFGDAACTAYFNSLYGEAASYVFLLLMCGAFLGLCGDGGGRSGIVWFYISAILFFGSKLQYALLAPVVSVASAALFARLKKHGKMIAALTAVSIALTGAIYAAAPKGLSRDTLYNSVFFGILRDSPDVKKDLDELGLPGYMAALAGTNAYDPLKESYEGAMLDNDFFGKIGRKDVIMFYLRNPGRFIEKMDLTAHSAFDNKIGMMGNFSRADGGAPHALNDFFTSYNSFKSVAYIRNFWALLLLFALALALLLKNIRAPACPFLVMLLLVGAAQFPLPIIGNGEADVAKQLFIFNSVVDILIFSFACYIITTLTKRKDKKCPTTS